MWIQSHEVLMWVVFMSSVHSFVIRTNISSDSLLWGQLICCSLGQVSLHLLCWQGTCSKWQGTNRTGKNSPLDIIFSILSNPLLQSANFLHSGSLQKCNHNFPRQYETWSNMSANSQRRDIQRSKNVGSDIWNHYQSHSWDCNCISLPLQGT